MLALTFNGPSNHVVKDPVFVQRISRYHNHSLLKPVSVNTEIHTDILMGLPDTCVDDLFRCVCYLFIWPIFMFFGFVGSLATIIILSSSKFNTTTFYYLKALSVSDLMYLLSAVGYLYEIFFLETSSQIPSITKADLRVSVDC